MQVHYIPDQVVGHVTRRIKFALLEPAVYSTDTPPAPITGAVANIVVERSVRGAAWASLVTAGGGQRTLFEVGNGVYEIELQAGDLAAGAFGLRVTDPTDGAEELVLLTNARARVGRE